MGGKGDVNELNSFQSSFSSRSLQLQGSRRAWLEKKCSVILADNGRVEFEKLITRASSGPVIWHHSAEQSKGYSLFSSYGSIWEFFMWVIGEGIITGAIIIQPDVWLMKYIAPCCLRSWWLVDSSHVTKPVCVIWVTQPFERQCSASLYSLFGKVSWANK